MKDNGTSRLTVETLHSERKCLFVRGGKEKLKLTAIETERRTQVQHVCLERGSPGCLGKKQPVKEKVKVLEGLIIAAFLIKLFHCKYSCLKDCFPNQLTSIIDLL